MKKFKAQFHTHTQLDPEDNIRYTETDLIQRAAELGFEVLAISCHDKLVYTDALVEFAREKGILLIPAIEKTIEDQHVLIVNVGSEAENIDTFEELEEYKKNHPECLIIAAHPYHPFTKHVGDNLIKYARLFDAVEWSAFYTKKLNPNIKAKKTAKSLHLPVMGNGDVHFLRYLNFTFSLVEAEKKETDYIISAIKQGKVEVQTKPMNIFQLVSSALVLLVTEKYKKLFRL